MIGSVMFLMKAMPRITLLTTVVALSVLMESCVYPPYPYYQPRYGYHPRTYLDDDYYSAPNRRSHKPRRERSEQAPDQDYGPPSRGDEPALKKSADRPVEKTPPPLAGDGLPKTNSEIPTATKTSNPNRVKSPYPPYGELDISGLRSGSLAKDPTTGEKFRVP